MGLPSIHSRDFISDRGPHETTFNFLSGQQLRRKERPRCSARILGGQLAAGTCEIVTLDRDSSQPRRTIARQTARCACRKGQIAGTTRARPACVDARIIKTKQWCDMLPCLEGEGCDLLINRSGWTCTQPGGRIKTTTVS
ncbi:chemokine-like protein TAFA-5 [Echinops telfairi]|uniref:Chemokine-like protein TAFA-5 n=1 Tax=Echinops telfairi TaxID=9371 RepID=A0AC55D4D5_ECHTE|nr:chemokine-like protein TAFA-5 [Echinops telfairi]